MDNQGTKDIRRTLTKEFLFDKENVYKVLKKEEIELLKELNVILKSVPSEEDLDCIKKYRIISLVSEKYMKYLKAEKEKISRDEYKEIEEYMNYILDNDMDIKVVKDFFGKNAKFNKKGYVIMRIIFEEKYGKYEGAEIVNKEFRNLNVLTALHSCTLRIEHDIFMEVVGNWSKLLQGAKAFDESKISLFCEEMIDNISYYLRKAGCFFSDLRWELCDIYTDFFNTEILTDEKIWKIYFSQSSLIKDYQKTLFYRKITDENQLFENLRRTGIYVLCYPDNCILDVLHYNYISNAYFRCVEDILNDIGSIDIISKKIKYISNIIENSGYVVDIDRKIKMTFLPENLGWSIWLGMAKELLYEYLNEEECRDFISVKNEMADDEHLVGLQKELDQRKNVLKVSKYFTPEFQIKIKYNNQIKALIDGKESRKRTFSYLLEQEEYLSDGASYFEKYIVEKQIGVFCSWMLYNATYDWVGLDYDKAKDALSRFSESVGAIHCLEARCWAIKQIEDILAALFSVHDYDYNRDVIPKFDLLIDSLNDFVEKFNVIYDKVYREIQQVYKYRWKWLLPLKDIQTEYFGKMSMQIHQLYTQNGFSSIVDSRFDELKSAATNNRRYRNFHIIWKRIHKENKN